jgi:hypothetical protein
MTAAEKMEGETGKKSDAEKIQTGGESYARI